MNGTLTYLTVVVGSIFIVIVFYKMLSVLSYCSYWAAYDTVMLARGQRGEMIMILLGFMLFCVLVNLWDLASCKEEVTFPKEFWVVFTFMAALGIVLQPILFS